MSVLRRNHRSPAGWRWKNMTFTAVPWRVSASWGRSRSRHPTQYRDNCYRASISCVQHVCVQTQNTKQVQSAPPVPQQITIRTAKENFREPLATYNYALSRHLFLKAADNFYFATVRPKIICACQKVAEREGGRRLNSRKR